MQLRRPLAFIGFIVVLPLLLTACFKNPPRAIPTGLQTLTGIVKSAEISLVRRGTHSLVVGGETLYYLESSALNLERFEGREVELQGLVEANTNPSEIPVLVVSKITGGPSALTRTWALDDLGITIDTPSLWHGKVAGKSAQFTASGSQTPILTLMLEGEDRLQAKVTTGSSVVKSQFMIGQHAVLRLENTDSGRERAEIDLRPVLTNPSSDVLTLLFTPTEEADIDPEAWSALRSDILRSIKFTAEIVSSKSSSSVSSILPLVTGSGAGMPCGGPAGILCKVGFRCQMTDTASDVGRCVHF